MNNKTLWVSVMAVFAVLIAAAFSYHEHESLEAARSQIIAGELRPIATLLKENQALTQELRSEPFRENDSSILESYLAKIRRDGVQKHADMKQRLDALAENNTALVTLVKAYTPHARTPAFNVEADKFRNYSSTWRDRWNSVMELFMAGGNYATSGVSFPMGFPSAVEAEISAAK
jgi:hypothetical protein